MKNHIVSYIYICFEGPAARVRQRLFTKEATGFYIKTNSTVEFVGLFCFFSSTESLQKLEVYPVWEHLFVVLFVVCCLQHSVKPQILIRRLTQPWRISPVCLFVAYFCLFVYWFVCWFRFFFEATDSNAETNSTMENISCLFFVCWYVCLFVCLFVGGGCFINHRF